MNDFDNLDCCGFFAGELPPKYTQRFFLLFKSQSGTCLFCALGSLLPYPFG